MARTGLAVIGVLAAVAVSAAIIGSTTSVPVIEVSMQDDLPPTVDKLIALAEGA